MGFAVDLELIHSEAEPKAEPKAESPSEKQIRKDLIEKCQALLDQKGGEKILGDILQTLGIRRVKECPSEKLADLVAAVGTKLP